MDTAAGTPIETLHICAHGHTHMQYMGPTPLKCMPRLTCMLTHSSLYSETSVEMCTIVDSRQSLGAWCDWCTAARTGRGGQAPTIWMLPPSLQAPRRPNLGGREFCQSSFPSTNQGARRPSESSLFLNEILICP